MNNSDDENAEGYLNEGYSLRQSQKYIESLELFDKALNLYPNNAKAWKNRGEALMGLKSYVKAIHIKGNETCMHS